MYRLLTDLLSCALYSFLWAFAFLPLRVLYIFSDFLYFVVYFVIRYRRNVVFKNLLLSFPEKKKEEIISIAKNFYKYFIDSFFEAMRLLHMSEQDVMNRFRYKNSGLLKEIYDKGDSIILLLPHYGNWEWLASLEKISPLHFLAIYKPLANRCIEKLYIRLRERFGGETVPMKKAFRKMVAYQGDKKQNITFFLYDQRPIGNELNYWITFLNQDTPVLLGAEKIARQLKQTVVFMKMRRVKRGYYESEFIKITDKAPSTQELEITNHFYKLLEELIREDPAPWLWSHNRWKYNKNDFVK